MSESKPQSEPPHDLLSELPDDLRAHLSAQLDPQAVLACARIDLDAEGLFDERYLVLTETALLLLGRGEGDGGFWQQAQDVGKLGEVRIVEGLGVQSLQFLGGGELLGEHHYTLRHARAVARLSRRLEKLIEGDLDEARKLNAEPQAPGQKPTRCAACGRVIPGWSEHCPACTSNRRILFRLIDFVKPYWHHALAGMLLAVLLTLASIAQPYLTKPLVDEGLGQADGQDGSYRLVIWYVALIAGLTVLVAVGSGLQRRLMGQLGSRVARHIRDRVYSHLHTLSLGFFSGKQTGSLVSRVTTDSDRLWDFIAFTVVELVAAVLTLVGVGAAMFSLYWKLALFVLLPIPLMLALMYVFHKTMHRMFHRWTHRWHDMTSVVTGALPGVRVIKAFGQESREIDRFEDKNRRVAEVEMSLARMFSLFGPVMMLCGHMGQILIWLLGGWWVVNGDIELGTLVAFTGLMMMFYRPIHMLAHMDRAFNRAATSAQRIFEVLDSQPDIYSQAESRSADALQGGIEFRDVSFSYDGVRRVLKDVSFTVEPGQMIGLAGPSGGGKTTTINLICRFYDVLAGQILIDGHDVRDYDLHSLRGRIGVVLQEPFLFRGTVAENIAYGTPGATREEIITAARAANAHDFIVGFPDGYDTVVGERGQTLSGGELQRVSIARAILGNPKILILDEATSSVDTETEKLIQEALDRLVADRTTIAIAHRLSTLRKADKLVILEDGELRETGTHEELAGKEDGLYAKLLNMQAEAQSLIAVKG